MNKEYKDKLVKALRSGKYAQGRGSLVSKCGHYYCCLGVLVDIAGEMKNHYKQQGCLHPALTKATGLSLKQQDMLIDMNDVHNNSFEEIADYIEANL
jgi:hypothetical protein